MLSVLRVNRVISSIGVGGTSAFWKNELEHPNSNTTSQHCVQNWNSKRKSKLEFKIGIQNGNQNWKSKPRSKT